MDKDLLEGFARYLEPQAALVRENPHCAGPSITISRQMGAGGIEIANILADQLSTRCCRLWVVFKKNLAQLVWQNHHLPAPVGRFFDEGIPQAIHDTVQELLGVRITGRNRSNIPRPLFCGWPAAGMRSLSGEGPTSSRQTRRLFYGCD